MRVRGLAYVCGRGARVVRGAFPLAPYDARAPRGRLSLLRSLPPGLYYFVSASAAM